MNSVFIRSCVALPLTAFLVFACGANDSNRRVSRGDGGPETGVGASTGGRRGGSGGSTAGTGGSTSSAGGDSGVADVSVADAAPLLPDASEVPDASDVPDARSGTDASRDAATAPKVVFVTSVAYTGNLGGIAGADAKCTALASAAGLGSDFKAWLSDASGSPATRFTRPTVDYVLVDRTTVFAHGWIGLTAVGGGALHALDLTELGTAPPKASGRCAGSGASSAAWVSTNADGTAAPLVSEGRHTCANWTTTALQTDGVGFGDPVGPNSWIGFCSTGDDVCSSVASLFCFEQ